MDGYVWTGHLCVEFLLGSSAWETIVAAAL